jgi:uncharacterized membrane protein YidH (DUF202 family)
MDLIILIFVTIGMIAMGVLTWRLLQRQEQRRSRRDDEPPPDQ